MTKLVTLADKYLIDYEDESYINRILLVDSFINNVPIFTHAKLITLHCLNFSNDPDVASIVDICK